MTAHAILFRISTYGLKGDACVVHCLVARVSNVHKVNAALALVTAAHGDGVHSTGTRGSDGVSV
jgi:hypothetical protein